MEVVMQELRAKLLQQRVEKNQNVDPKEVPTLSPVPKIATNPIVAAPPRCDFYERFKCMRALEFEGSSDLLVVDEWLPSMKVILDFMNLTK